MTVIRALALALVNAGGQIVWKQNDGLSDEAPLNLEQVEVEFALLGLNH